MSLLAVEAQPLPPHLLNNTAHTAKVVDRKAFPDGIKTVRLMFRRREQFSKQSSEAGSLKTADSANVPDLQAPSC